MKIFVSGVERITDLEKQELHYWLESILKEGHHLYMVVGRNISSAVLEYFVFEEKYAPQLHMLSIQPYHQMDEAHRESVEYLCANGSAYKSLGYTGLRMSKIDYMTTMQKLVQDKDVCMCFTNGSDAKAYIPVDCAYKQKVKGVVFEFCRDREDLFLRSQDEKMRMANQRAQA